MHRKVFDYAQDSDGDIVIANGDLVRAESTYQHQHDLLLASKGDFKNAPLSGVGIMGWLLEDDNILSLQQEIQSQWEQDGIKDIKKIDVSKTPKIITEAYYL